MKRIKNFSIPFPKRLQQLISRFLFYLANLLKIQLDPLVFLRELQRGEQKFSKKIDELSTESLDVQVQPLAIRITEVYLDEEIDLLIKAFENHFSIWKDNDDVGMGEWISDDWLVAGVKRIGYITNNRFAFPGRKIFKVKRLRSEIDYIEVSLFKFLRTAIGVSFDVVLSDKGRAEFKRRFLAPQQRHQTLLHAYYPFLGFFSYTGQSYNFYPVSEALDLLQSISASVSGVIRNYFPGSFSGGERFLGKKLPAIEIFTLNTSSEENWTENKKLLSRLGVNRRGTYKAKNLLFSWGPANRRQMTDSNHKIVLVPEAFSSSPVEEAKQNGYTVFSDLRYQLDSWFPYLASISLLDLLKHKVRAFRKEITVAINRRKRFGLQFHLNQLAHFQQSIYIYRNAENEIKSYLDRGLLGFDAANDLQYTLQPKDKAPYLLSQQFYDVVHWYLKTLNPFFKILESYYSSYISLLNTGVTYRLSVLAILIAIVSIIYKPLFDMISAIDFVAWLKLGASFFSSH